MMLLSKVGLSQMKTIISLCLVSSSLFAVSQAKCYEIVKDEARKYLIDGKRYQTTAAKIYDTESDCRQTAIGDLNTNYMSMGAGQIRVPTVHFMAEKYPDIAAEVSGLSDFEIGKKLIKDIRFSVRITMHYLKYYMEAGYSYQDAVIMYNGFWEVDHKGRAIRDENGKRVKNVAYFNRVMRSDGR